MAMKHPFMITLAELPAQLILAFTYIAGVGIAAFVFFVLHVWQKPQTGWRTPRKSSSAQALY